MEDIRMDKRIIKIYCFYTDMKWGQAQNYHIALDSGELGIEKCVELLAGLYKADNTGLCGR